MKRIFLVILIAQTIAILLFVVYSLVQATAAVKAQKEAVANFELAQKNAEEAIHQEEKVKKLEIELKLCCKKP